MLGRTSAILGAGLLLSVGIIGAFLFAGRPSLRATNNNTVATVDPAGYGEESSVAIGTDSLPVIGYSWHNIGTGETHFKIAHCGTADCTSGNLLTAVNDTGGNESALAIGTDGLPIVSYRSWNGSDSDLSVVHCGNTACTAGNTVTAVDTFGNFGGFTSIAIGTDGLPVISYGGFFPSVDLRVAHCGNASCTSGTTISTVDTGAGYWTSIAIGLDGLPIISYATQGGALRVAHCGGVSCSGGNTLTTVDNVTSVTDRTSLAIAAGGLPVVSYKVYESSHFVLKVIHCGNALCTGTNSISTVGSAAGNGEYSSLAIGTDGLPIIVGNVGNQVRGIHCGDVSCSTGNAIAFLGDATSRQTAITIGADGLPLITYGRGIEMRSLHCGDIACGSLKPTPTPTATATPSGHDPAVTSLAVPTWPIPPIGAKKVSGTVQNQGTLLSSYTVTLRVDYGFDYSADWIGQPGDAVQNSVFCGSSCVQPFYSVLTFTVPSILPGASLGLSRDLRLGCPSPVDVVPETVFVQLSASDATGLDDNPSNSSLGATRSVYCRVSTPTSATPTPTPVSVGGITFLPDVALNRN